MMEWSEESEKEAEEQPADDERFFRPWAEAMVRAEMSRGQHDQMWDRIKTRLDNLHKAEELLKEVFGEDAQMVEDPV